MNFKRLLLGKNLRWTLFRVLLLASIFTFYFSNNFKLVYSRGDSMSPTMGNKMLIVGVDFYDFDNMPMRYDVVVVYDSIERDLLTKRIIGLPGETICVIDGLLFIDGEELADDLYGFGWFDHKTFDMYPQEIPFDMYYIIGDNREDSVHGLYLYGEIVGRVLNVE